MRGLFLFLAALLISAYAQAQQWEEFGARNDAQAFCDRLTNARLQEAWGGRYRSQTVWPDGVTTKACQVVVKDTNDSWATNIDRRLHRRHMTAPEDSALRTREQMESLGWFPEVALLTSKAGTGSALVIE